MESRDPGSLPPAGAPPIAASGWGQWRTHNSAVVPGNYRSGNEPQRPRQAPNPPTRPPVPPYQPLRAPIQPPSQQQLAPQQRQPGGGGVIMKPPTCWKCGCNMKRLQGRNQAAAFMCEHVKFCGATRRSALENFDMVCLELKGPNLCELCLSMPRSQFQDKILPAFLKRRKLEASIRQVAGKQWEAAFPLADYSTVLEKVMANAGPNVEFRRVPHSTLMAARDLAQGTVLCPPCEVEERFARIPAQLSRTLLDFQVEGVKYALARGGRCLIADEMGTGKTLQAVAAMSCYSEDWPLLIVVPASLRMVWAEAVERSLPFLRPADIYVIFGDRHRLYKEEDRPPVIISSYAMIRNLYHTLGKWQWDSIIFDESHKLATSKTTTPDVKQTVACLELGRRAKRVILLTGTPSLTRPFDLFNQVDMLRSGLLGKDRWEFGRNYCTGVRWTHRMKSGPKALALYDGCCHGSELHSLLKSTIMIRRLKSQVLSQLPPLVRTVIRVAGSNSSRSSDDKEWAEGGGGGESGSSRLWDDVSPAQAEMIREEESMMLESEARMGRVSQYHQVGRDKLEGALDWVAERVAKAMHQQHLAPEGDEGGGSSSRKLVLFGYHLDVLDALEAEVQWLYLHNGKREGKRGGKKGGGTAKGKGKGGEHEEVEEEADQEDQEDNDAENDEGGRKGAARGVKSWSSQSVGGGVGGGSTFSLIRIDGRVPGQERQGLVARFTNDPNCLVAIVGITAGGVGLDLSVASCAAFVEFPPDSSSLRQAEDRLHRRNQRSVVNIYYLVLPPGSLEDAVWQKLNAMLKTNTGVFNSSAQAEELVVERVLSSSPGDSTTTTTIDQSSVREQGGQQQQLPLRDGLEEGAGHVETGGGQEVEEVAAGGIGERPQEQQLEGEETHTAAAAAAVKMCAGVGEEEEDLKLAALADDAFGADEEPHHHQEEEESPDCLMIHDLWFEFSRHTGRIHLHAQPDGSEPMQIQLNPSDYWQAAEAMEHAKKTGGLQCRERREAALAAIPPLPSSSSPSLPLCRLSDEAKESLLQTITEYRAMVPRQRLKLFGHVLLPPLKDYCKRAPPARLPARTTATTGTATSDTAQVLSFRRHVPQAEWDFYRPPEDRTVSYRKVLVPRPRRSDYREVFQRTDPSRKTPLCLKCHTPCSFAGSPRTLGDLVCSVDCLSYLTSRFKGGYRRVAADRDQGVCELCQLDCRELVSKIKVLARYEDRQRVVLDVNGLFKERPKLLERLCREPIEGNAWHADHIVQVSHGGGECGEDNIRTLCVLCHVSITAKQQSERMKGRKLKPGNKRRRGDGDDDDDDDHHGAEVVVPPGKLLAIGEDGQVEEVVSAPASPTELEGGGEGTANAQQQLDGDDDGDFSDDDWANVLCNEF